MVPDSRGFSMPAASSSVAPPSMLVPVLINAAAKGGFVPPFTLKSPFTFVSTVSFTSPFRFMSTSAFPWPREHVPPLLCVLPRIPVALRRGAMAPSGVATIPIPVICPVVASPPGPLVASILVAIPGEL
eukprot:jgi/Mesvir1/13191/Mv24063-RA.1